MPFDHINSIKNYLTFKNYIIKLNQYNFNLKVIDIIRINYSQRKNAELKKI